MRPTFEQAQANRNDGMKRAVDHAKANWPNEAYSFLLSFARTHELFISEDVSEASKQTGFPQPETDRAWGMIYRRAAKAGIIVQDGIGRSRRRHASVCPRWRSRVVQKETV